MLEELKEDRIEATMTNIKIEEVTYKVGKIGVNEDIYRYLLHDISNGGNYYPFNVDYYNSIDLYDLEDKIKLVKYDKDLKEKYKNIVKDVGSKAIDMLKKQEVQKIIFYIVDYDKEDIIEDLLVRYVSNSHINWFDILDTPTLDEDLIDDILELCHDYEKAFHSLDDNDFEKEDKILTKKYIDKILKMIN